MLWIRHGCYYELKHIQTPTARQEFHIKITKACPHKDLRIFFVNV